MRKSGFLMVGVVAAGILFTSCGTSKENVKLSNGIDSVSYAIGLTNGNGFRESLGTLPGEPANIEALLAGFSVAVKKNESSYKMTLEEAQSYIQNYFMQVQMKESAKAREEERVFFDKNKTEEGVITTASGLQYKVLQEGNGAKPSLTDQVKVHYTGTLLDGTTFDSSIDRGEPVVFSVTQVIPGWTEGLLLMSVGSKYKFWIPFELGYGERGAGDLIKPYSTLIFEVELLEIVTE
jgi:FKBP-type peptidyl-prolyl cis-trans isomerase FkpA/FKBP-type peptidyl-prolyl cis-trans isomerase FklB